MDAKCMEKKVNASCYFEQMQEATTHKAAATFPHFKKRPNKTNKIRGTSRETRTNSKVTFFYGPLHIDTSGFADKQAHRMS